MYHLTLHDIKNEGSAVHVLGPVVLMADKKSADRRAVCQSVDLLKLCQCILSRSTVEYVS